MGEMDTDDPYVDEIQNELHKVTSTGLSLLTEGNLGETLLDFGIVAPGGWAGSMGTEGLEYLRQLRSGVPSGNVVLVDTTTLIEAAQLLLTGSPPSAVSLADLGSVADALCLYDQVAYLGPVYIDEIGEIGLGLNRLLGDDVFVSVTPLNSNNYGLRLVFDDAVQAVEDLFRPTTSEVRRKAQLATSETWSRLLREPFDIAKEYEGSVASHSWRSAGAGYGAWLLDRFGDESASGLLGIARSRLERWGLSVSELVSEAHIRAMFNAHLAYFVLEVPYRSSALRSPWLTDVETRSATLDGLFHVRAARSRQTAAIEERLTAAVQARQVLYQDVSLGQLSVKPMLSLALRDSDTPSALLTRLAQMRADAAKFRAKQGEILSSIRGETGRRNDTMRAKQLAQALAAELPADFMESASDAAGLTLKLAPRMAMAPTWGSGVAAANTLVSSYKDQGLLTRLARRLFRPEFHWISSAANDAGSVLNSQGAVRRVWSMDALKADVLWGDLKSLAEFGSQPP